MHSGPNNQKSKAKLILWEASCYKGKNYTTATDRDENIHKYICLNIIMYSNELQEKQDQRNDKATTSKVKLLKPTEATKGKRRGRILEGYNSKSQTQAKSILNIMVLWTTKRNNI